MSDGTKIEWTDATWNPITGCSVVSAGCRHCYAMKLAGTRLQHHPSRAGLTTDSKAGPVWNGAVRFNEQWLGQPLAWKRPRRIFVCAHGDLFHENVADEWIDRVFAVMALAPQHTFQVLTKRAERMRGYLSEPALQFRLDRCCRALAGPAGLPPAPGWPLPNVWIGVSVEDQAAADERIPLLLQTPAAVRWISAEPLLGPVNLSRWMPHEYIDEDGSTYQGQNHPCVICGQRTNALHWTYAVASALDWVVVGGESGTNARPMHPDWARSLRDQCADAGVPFLFKQWGEWLPYLGLPVPGKYTSGGLFLRLDGRLGNQGEWWEGKAQAVDKVGKKAAGRLLDSKLHDGYPEARP